MAVAATAVVVVANDDDARRRCHMCVDMWKNVYRGRMWETEKHLFPLSVRCLRLQGGLVPMRCVRVCAAAAGAAAWTNATRSCDVGVALIDFETNIYEIKLSSSQASTEPYAK